jgi:chromatin remodeling complex protein RSC6
LVQYGELEKLRNKMLDQQAANRDESLLTIFGVCKKHDMVTMMLSLEVILVPIASLCSPFQCSSLARY